MSYFKRKPFDDESYPLFADIKSEFGFIPNFYKAQTDRLELIQAETALVHEIMIREGALSRKLREYVFIVCSAANLSTYCLAAHCEIFKMLGIDGPEPEQIAVDYLSADLPLEVKALLNYSAKLNREPAQITQDDVDTLRTFGYTDQQIMEAVMMVGLARFANHVAAGLGAVPDFELPVQMDAAMAGASSPL